MKKNRYFEEIVRILFFAGLSVVLGLVSEVEGGISNFRELPLLIYVFSLKIPGLIILTSIVSSIPTNPQATFVENFLIHFPGLVAAWGGYFALKKLNLNTISKSITWFLITCIYYTLFLIPTWVVLTTLNSEGDFVNMYLVGLKSIRFEMIATAFITVLYLIQKDIRQNLIQHKRNLENEVRERTEELSIANENLLNLNEELISSSEQIKLTNSNLDELVKKRSDKIADQLKILHTYADMNAHDVRAPLARILGLSYLIKNEPNKEEKNMLLDKLFLSAEELDTIVKEMNRLLERETLL